MPFIYRNLAVSPQTEEESLPSVVASLVGLPATALIDFRIVRKGVDARRKPRVKLIYTVSFMLVDTRVLLVPGRPDSRTGVATGTTGGHFHPPSHGPADRHRRQRSGRPVYRPAPGRIRPDRHDHRARPAGGTAGPGCPAVLEERPARPGKQCPVRRGWGRDLFRRQADLPLQRPAGALDTGSGWRISGPRPKSATWPSRISAPTACGSW